MLVFVANQIGISTPLNLIAGRRLRRGARAGGDTGSADKGKLRLALRHSAFWMLAAVFGLSTMVHTMLVTYFIPIFTGLGMVKADAVAAASMVGPFQVLGRIVLMVQGVRIGARGATRAALAGLVLACAILLGAGLEPRLVFLFAAIQGASVGMLSILRPVLIAETLGRAGFGAISGTIAAVPLVASALAPVVGALVLTALGVGGFVAVTLTLALVTLGLAAALRRPGPG